MRKILLTGITALLLLPLTAKDFTVNSPDKTLNVTVSVGETLSWKAQCDGLDIINPSELSMTFGNGKVIGKTPKLKKSSIGEPL